MQLKKWWNLPTRREYGYDNWQVWCLCNKNNSWKWCGSNWGEKLMKSTWKIPTWSAKIIDMWVVSISATSIWNFFVETLSNGISVYYLDFRIRPTLIQWSSTTTKNLILLLQGSHKEITELLLIQVDRARLDTGIWPTVHNDFLLIMIFSLE